MRSAQDLDVLGGRELAYVFMTSWKRKEETCRVFGRGDRVPEALAVTSSTERTDKGAQYLLIRAVNSIMMIMMSDVFADFMDNYARVCTEAMSETD